MAVNQLNDVREQFVSLVTEANIKALLDRLQHPHEGRRFINKFEAEEVIQKKPERADKARSLIDMVISKGDAACKMMLTTWHNLDPSSQILNTPAHVLTSQRALGSSSWMPPSQGSPPASSRVMGAERTANEINSTVINYNYTMPIHQAQPNLKRKAESIGIGTVGSTVNNAKKPKIEDHLEKNMKTAPKAPVPKKPAAAKKPKVKKPAAAKKPKVKKPAAAKKPKVKKPAAAKKPKVKKPAAAKKPKVKKPAAEKKPKVKKPAAAKKPKVKKPAAKK
ncbi:late histone H1 isoform X1 [Oncorhynchus tshawytscha]|uniref:late histone H1 isoform X1 n=1 Tax=Oncorhynchus tshawytscha TaxID=74940 RepID=UPI001C3DE3C6|nr:late histone H1 isoform X1 [Oncorhynchus tshawytscha]